MHHRYSPVGQEYFFSVQETEHMLPEWRHSFCSVTYLKETGCVLDYEPHWLWSETGRKKAQQIKNDKETVKENNGPKQSKHNYKDRNRHTIRDCMEKRECSAKITRIFGACSFFTCFLLVKLFVDITFHCYTDDLQLYLLILSLIVGNCSKAQ